DYTVYTEGDRVSAFPRRWMPMLERVRRTGADIIHEGVHVATLRGKDILPAHALIMSSTFSTGSLPSVEVAPDTALAYLRGQSPVLPSDTPRGPVVISYLGSPLGLVKNLGSRTNSLYPQQWRLRMG
ncbi:MAG: rRNA cytosine-C5-methyltransferase, partial [Duncaniella sp.]|nr:rRNA cytosine-C5-methyltransferase [Duncaniella sp.]